MDHPAAYEPSNKRVEYTKTVEDAELMGEFKRDSNYITLPKKSAEGGTKTTGFGHKLAVGETIPGKNQKQTKDPLNADLINSYNKAGKAVDEMEGPGSWQSLTLNEREALADYQFNLKGGVKTFPSLTKAIVGRNQGEIIKQFRRYYTTPEGKTKEVSERNKQWWQTYGRDLSGGIKYQQSARVAEDLRALDELGVDTGALTFG